MKRRAFRLICSAVLLAALALNGLTAGAAGSVTYDGSAQSFIFAPGSGVFPHRPVQRLQGRYAGRQS